MQETGNGSEPITSASLAIRPLNILSSKFCPHNFVLEKFRPHNFGLENFVLKKQDELFVLFFQDKFSGQIFALRTK